MKTPAEAIELLQTGMVTELSLDHDLGLTDGKREVTGHEVVTPCPDPCCIRRRGSPIKLGERWLCRFLD